MFRLRDELRAGVQWRCENLAGPEFLAGELPFHVVFCRNVLIYFHAEARRMAVRHLHRLLSREGILCATPAEARIFNAAGFASLGSECPLAFRHRDAIAAESPAPAIAEKPTTLVGQVRNLSYVEPNAGAPDVKSFNGPGDPFHELGPALLRAARAAADNGRLEEADALCSRMLSQNPASAEAHCLGGVIHQAQGRLDEARRSFEKALYLDPRHYEALVHMMLLAEQTGDCVGAANYRRRADRVAPGETE